MRFVWPQDTVFQRLVLDVEQDCCEQCGRDLHICDHRIRRIYTLEHPLQLCCRLVHCSDPACPSRPRTLSPAAELSIALPGWLIGWDVFCFVGHRRFARHWSVPQIKNQLLDAYRIKLSDDAISIYIRRYQDMVAARQQDFANLQLAYQGIDSVDLTIDGLQPEKGHETLYAVRELKAKRVWFAEALLSSNEAEVRRLLARAAEMARQLGKPVRLWMSDKQDAFVKGIKAEFPGVPHLYCGNHFLRELARPTLEKDSHAKVAMRKKVRGLRSVESSVLKQRRVGKAASDAAAAAPAPAAEAEATASVAAEAGPGAGPATVAAGRAVAGALAVPQSHPDATPQRRGGGMDSKAKATAAEPSAAAAPQTDEDGQTAAQRAGDVVLDYCAAVRGIVNDDQGGPLHPPGLRMAEALEEVRESLQRCLELNKPGPAHGQLQRLARCIDKGLQAVEAERQEVKEQVKEVQRVAQTLDAQSGTLQQRKEKFERLHKEYQHKAGQQQTGESYGGLCKVMLAWAAGLFIKVEGEGVPQDNLEMERWFRNPKGHERRIHGHKHAGVRIVQEGPTLLLTLDAHVEHDRPFSAEELLPYRHAHAPEDQEQALQRRKVMRKARSKKNDGSCSES